MRKPFWVSDDKYPFNSKTVNVTNHRLHYLDEGDGFPVVFLHGNPSWSFLYRHLIRDLREDFRCLAPDWFGFGLSAKSEDIDYTPEAHAEALDQFIDELDIEQYHLVVHDWGGPIGLDVASRHPEQLGRLIVFNSWLGPLTQNSTVDWFSSVMGSVIGTSLTTSASLIPILMSLGTLKRLRFLRRTFRHYRGPHPEPTAICQFARSLTRDSDWLSIVKRRVSKRLSNKPLLLLWGEMDPVLSLSLIDEWTECFRDHRVKRIKQASHFVPEDIGQQYNEEIERFLTNS